MGRLFGNVIGGTVEGLVRHVVVPVTSVIPALVERGVLFAGFALLWAAVGAAVVADPGALDATWRSIGSWPLPVQGLAWLLFLPVMAGVWAWETDWPLAIRIAAVAGLAAWNLLVFIPRPASRREAGVNA